jgi:hypothetical protein
MDPPVMVMAVVAPLAGLALKVALIEPLTVVVSVSEAVNPLVVADTVMFSLLMRLGGDEIELAAAGIGECSAGSGRDQETCEGETGSHALMGSGMKGLDRLVPVGLGGFAAWTALE